MAMYYNVKKVRNLYFNGKCITRLALGKEMTRLVEGDDFVRAQWLVGDGSAWIQILGFVRNENWEITTSIANIQPTTHWILLYGYGYDAETGYNKAWMAFCNSNATYIALRRGDGTSYNDIAHSNIASVNTIIDGHNNVILNGETFSMIGRQYGQKPEFRIFTQFRDNYSTTIEKCSFSEFVVKENNLPILDLIPCRLLRPIPATIDANGIARNAGDCGMYDSVSGKFYGNVASSGTFTVSDN